MRRDRCSGSVCWRSKLPLRRGLGPGDRTDRCQMSSALLAEIVESRVHDAREPYGISFRRCDFPCGVEPAGCCSRCPRNAAAGRSRPDRQSAAAAGSSASGAVMSIERIFTRSGAAARSASRFSVRRPAAPTCQPAAIYSLAISSPMPEVAPRMTIRFMGIIDEFLQLKTV